MQDIHDDTTPVDAARIFHQSADVAVLLEGEVAKFYMVLVGYQSGIFLSWPERQASVLGFLKPVYKKEHNLQDALEWMITKAHHLGDARDLPSLWGFSLTLSHLSLNDHRDAPSSPHVPPVTSCVPHAWKKPAAPSTSTDSSKSPESPLLYQYLQEINVICGELHQLLFDDTPMPSFGAMADWYLQAHGYTMRAILHIAYAHDSSTLCTEFVKAITDKGMPVTEAHFLWGLITCN
ncbi:hypothetical protein BDR07DRAFT_1375130 [Suillus spraguei]|nr:hypothetical protein BDR07DRAFT_1375130 [Suillus spraguei]